MIKMKHIFKVVVPALLTLTLFGLTGCGSGPTPSGSNGGAGNKPTLTKLTVGYPSGTMSKSLFLQTGIDTGIFTKYGLEVQPKAYTVGGQVVEDLAGNNLDFGMAGPSASLDGAAKGADLKIIASAMQNDCPLVARQEITSVKELNGKKVGTPGVSSIQETMLDYLESQQGIKTIHVYANAANLVQLLQKGEIDAIVAWEPLGAQAVAKVGAHYLLNTIIPGAEAEDFTVTGKLFRENPNTVVQFLKAAEAIKQYLNTHLTEREQVAAGSTGLPESVIAQAVQSSHNFITPMQLNVNSIKLSAMQDIASGKLTGVKQSGLDAFLAKNIDTTLLQKALQ
ncbi:MAG: ABC transporter substrate-binding protein [Peptococcaceae bacterium]|nr:ABC transporter substrate-binding protein [Peptococcaceae bacterium]